MSQQIQVTITLNPHQYVGGQLMVEQKVFDQGIQHSVRIVWGIIKSIHYSSLSAEAGIYVVMSPFFDKVQDDPWTSHGTNIFLLREDGTWAFVADNVVEFQQYRYTEESLRVEDKVTLYPATAELLYDVTALTQEAAANAK